MVRKMDRLRPHIRLESRKIKDYLKPSDVLHQEGFFIVE